MEFTDFAELKKLMATSVQEFEFEENQQEDDEYEKGFTNTYMSG